MSSRRVVVVGGGAAGFFGAIACAQKQNAEVILLEKSPHFLTKVRISGGGRCNVTHSCFDVRAMTGHYPRGERALISPFTRFQASDTIAWFESRGVKLKTESDGRMFPVTDSSQTIIDCLLSEAQKNGVRVKLNHGVARAVKNPGGDFELTLSNGENLRCDQLLLATGGVRGGGALAADPPQHGAPAVSLFGHTLEPPVPSLFTFHIDEPWLRELAGVSVESVEASVPETNLRERGPVLMTHMGLSGPVILRLSAWGARLLHGFNYQFALRINWLPELDEQKIITELKSRRTTQSGALVSNLPIRPLPHRLWEKLVRASGITPDTRWAILRRDSLHQLAQRLCRSEFQVTGKSPNKAEFVTCGGVRLSEVDFKTMESKLCPGLYFAGELLDIDGITGGFNFQAAWTTGWIAGNSMGSVALHDP